MRAGPGILLLFSSFLWMPFQRDIKFHMTSEKNLVTITYQSLLLGTNVHNDSCLRTNPKDTQK